MAKTWVSGVLLFVCWLAFSHVTNGRSHFMFGKYRGSLKGSPPKSDLLQTVQPLPEQYFEQQLDHFNEADTRTWPQRYWINDKYYKPGGPVFVMIGGEGPENPIWMVEGQWINWAQKYHAICFNLEHRFYGKSHPVPDLTVPNLRYLSSEQALADLANFITNQTASSPHLTEAKVITFGGSYPGSLSAWFRSKYPHIVHAAVSSSAPMVAVEDFSEYLLVVKKSLARSSPQCVDNIATANAELEQALQNPESTKKLQQQFQLCTAIDITKKKDIQNLVESLAGNFEGVVQYNRDNRAFEGALATNITIDTLCEIMTDASIPVTLDRYAQVNSLLLSAYGQKCLNFTYQSFLDPLLETDWTDETSAGGRQWTYQTCTEFGFYQTSDANGQPFSSMFPLKFFVDQCFDLFGLNETVLIDGIRQSNLYYGGRELIVDHVVFVNGDIDPWHALGITKRHGYNAPAVLIKGAAHCADMYPSREEDIPELLLARLTIELFLDKWIVL